ncbi:MAG TPA: hypothetical protein VGM39_08510 [Kofleriaceae bacterium]|jgi:hypothetical protein
MARLALACALLGGCTLTHDDPPKPLPDMVEVGTYAALPTTKLDVLFQIDNSAGTADIQKTFAAAVPDFIAALDASPGGRPDLHIGVVTSDLGVTGSSGTPAADLGSCSGEGDAGNFVLSGAPVSGSFISDIDGGDGPITRNTNYTGELASVLSSMMKVGSVGCGFEQQLRATRKALEGNPSNAGFSRADANLLVVVVTDEDDCSVKDSHVFSSGTELGPVQSFRCTRFGLRCDESLDTEGEKHDCIPDEDSQYIDGIQPYADFFATLRGDRARSAVAVVAAAPSPVSVSLRTVQGSNAAPELALDHSCMWDGSLGPDVGDPGVRLASVTGHLQSHGLYQSICQQEQHDHARAIVNLANQMAGVICLDTAVIDDTACAVTVERAATSRDIPACAVHPDSDCFEVATDAVACPHIVDNQRLVVHLASPAADEYVRAHCVPREQP